MKEIDFSNRKALERFQRNLNSHIFGNNVHGLRQLILIQDIILLPKIYMKQKGLQIVIILLYEGWSSHKTRFFVARTRVNNNISVYCAYSKLSLRGNLTVMGKPMIRIA